MDALLFSGHSAPLAVEQISTSIVKPYPPTPKPLQDHCHLTPWDLAMLSISYIQKGLLFTNPRPSFDVISVIQSLKASLAVALRCFSPLAGRLVVGNAYDDHGNHTGKLVYVDCNDNGAGFIHAVASGITVADVLAVGEDVPQFFRDFFPMEGAVNCDGNTLPLVVVQMTELVDGHFLALSFNHAIGDGTSYWRFFNAWAEIYRSAAGNVDGDFAAVPLSHPSVLGRWFGENMPPLKLPFKTYDEFIERFNPPFLCERVFHFSKDSLATLKARANRDHEEEGGHRNDGTTISSLQALSALVWRCLTRARSLPAQQKTSCWLAIENRSRLHPALQKDYFGNCFNSVVASATAEEVVGRRLGWAGALLRQAVAEHDHERIMKTFKGWIAPIVRKTSMFDSCTVVVGSSPRFEMYECEFGWGKAAAVRSGSGHKFCGKLNMYPGREGGGSMDLEICLVPSAMDKLLVDSEFMEYVSLYS